MSEDRVLLAHGSGGKLSHDLIERLFLRRFDNPALLPLDDSAVLGVSEADVSRRLAFSTDSYVISPLSMSGARPLWLSSGFIIEEGLPLADLERIVASMADTARQAGVQIVTGDTKVVDRGSADKLFINTAGVGWVPAGIEIAGNRAQPGDSVLLSGTIGDHGMTILTQREGLQFDSPLQSDCAPLNGLVSALLDQLPPGAVHCLRDPTRGGLATALNELAGGSGVGIEIEETALPVREAVRAACELLGLDPLYVANEGKLIAIVAPQFAERALEILRGHEYGRQAAIIGQVTDEHTGRVVQRTALGARRILDMLVILDPSHPEPVEGCVWTLGVPLRQAQGDCPSTSSG